MALQICYHKARHLLKVRSSVDAVHQVYERHHTKEDCELDVSLCSKGSHEDGVEQDGCNWEIWEEGDLVLGQVELRAGEMEDDGCDEGCTKEHSTSNYERLAAMFGQPINQPNT